MAEMSRARVRMLSENQRSLLIDHIDGRFEMGAANRHQRTARSALLKAKLIYGHPLGSPKPRQTVLTEAGRAAVGLILGDCADLLVRAGLLQQENPLQVLRRLKAMGEWPASSVKSPGFAGHRQDPGIVGSAGDRDDATPVALRAPD
jgi:hypothetical protein